LPQGSPGSRGQPSPDENRPIRNVVCWPRADISKYVHILDTVRWIEIETVRTNVASRRGKLSRDTMPMTNRDILTAPYERIRLQGSVYIPFYHKYSLSTFLSTASRGQLRDVLRSILHEISRVSPWESQKERIHVREAMGSARGGGDRRGERGKRVDRRVGTKEAHNSPRCFLVAWLSRGREERRTPWRLVQPGEIIRRRDIRFCTTQRPREIQRNRMFNRAKTGSYYASKDILFHISYIINSLSRYCHIKKIAITII